MTRSINRTVHTIDQKLKPNEITEDNDFKLNSEYEIYLFTRVPLCKQVDRQGNKRCGPTVFMLDAFNISTCYV